jgi:hypothetical protein
MKDKDILEEYIDRYLEGSLSDEEKKNFELKMSEDPEFLKEVELQRSIIRAVRNENLEKIIRKEEEKIKKQKNIRKLFISFGSLAIAASVAGFFYIGHLNQYDTLAGEYYESYTYTPFPSRGEENAYLTEADSIFLNALQDIENDKISSAITSLENLKNSEPEMLAATEQAVNWYLSLAYLKKGKKNKAKVLLQEIEKSTNNEYIQKAKDLLKELE